MRGGVASAGCEWLCRLQLSWRVATASAGRPGNTGDEHQRRTEDLADVAFEIHASRGGFRAALLDDARRGTVLSDVRHRAFSLAAQRRRSDEIHSGDRIRNAGIVRAQPPIAGERRALPSLSANVARDAARRARSGCVSGDLALLPLAPAKAGPKSAVH